MNHQLLCVLLVMMAVFTAINVVQAIRLRQRLRRITVTGLELLGATEQFNQECAMATDRINDLQTRIHDMTWTFFDLIVQHPEIVPDSLKRHITLIDRFKNQDISFKDLEQLLTLLHQLKEHYLANREYSVAIFTIYAIAEVERRAPEIFVEERG